MPNPIIKNMIKSAVEKMIKKQKMVYIGDEKMSFLGANGEKLIVTFDEMALQITDAMGIGLAMFGVTPMEIKEICEKVAKGKTK